MPSVQGMNYRIGPARRWWTVYVGIIVITLVLWALGGGGAEWLEALGAFGGMCIAGAAGVLGLNIWREEQRGQRRAAVAETVYETTYILAEALRSVRAPVPRLNGATGPTIGSRKALLDAAHSKFDQIGLLALKARVILGSDLDQPLEDLRAIRDRLASSLAILLASEPDGVQPDTERLLRACRKDAFLSGNDEIEQRIEHALILVAATCGPHLRLEEKED